MYGICTKMFPNLFQHQRKGGILVQPRSFIGRLGAFVMSLWWYWFIQSHLLDSELQPIHHHYDAAKQHCDHANPRIAFHFAYPATRNLSRHGHRNHGKEDTIINTARKRSWDCHRKNKDSGKFQQFIWLYPEIIRKKTVFCPFSVCKGVSLHLRQCMPKWRTFAWHQMFPVMRFLRCTHARTHARTHTLGERLRANKLRGNKTECLLRGKSSSEKVSQRTSKDLHEVQW